MHVVEDENKPAIFVDLDETLVRTDLLLESVLTLLKINLFGIFLIIVWALKGRAFLKRQVADRVNLRFDLLPYNEKLIEYLRAMRKAGRRLVLATASDSRLAAGVNAHLRLFDDVLASDGITNLKGARKLHAILNITNAEQFEYIGDSRADLPIFERAHHVVLVNPSRMVQQRLSRMKKEVYVINDKRATLSTFVKGIRLYQWIKNVLVFVPLFTSHNWFDWDKLTTSTIGFICFGLCASSIYLLNDLFDLDADRAHPKKMHRPLASGRMSLASGVFWSFALMLIGITIAASLKTGFLVVLCVYVVMTTVYTLQLKQIVLVDVIILAFLYTTRVVGGGVLIGVDLSFWLLAFSMFLFLSLSLVKRCSELVTLKERNQSSSTGRDYQVTDLPYLQAMGLISGYMAVLVVALFINDPSVQALYSHQRMLWLLCPLLVYWISRMWLKTGRGEMHSDPIVYALKDSTSLLVLAGVLAVVVFSV